ncbi:MAG: amidohydrolase [Spirochaetales bacterium]
MKILIKNAYILTINGKNYENGQIFIEDDTIVFVGPEYVGNLVADKIIDAKNKIVMPGFVNAHAHTGMSILKNISDSSELQTWLFDKILPLEKGFTFDSMYFANMLGIMNYVRNGITTFCDAYYFVPSLVKAVKESGIRATIGVGFHPDDLRKIEDIEREYLTYKKESDRINFVVYSHSIYANDEAQINALINLAHKHKLGVYTHISETLEEVSDCTVKNNDLTPPQLLEQLGFFDLPATVAHAVHTDKVDHQIFKEYGVNVVSCPASNLKLGSGIAPLNSMNKLGINIALGTDSAASNNGLDMFREMYLASTLQKGTLQEASVMPAEEVLKMATINGAKALGLKKVGKLKEGYKADLIMLDIDSPNLTPLNDVESAVVYSAGVQNIVMTMVNGKILYDNGKYYIGTNEKEILKNGKEALKTLMDK